LQITACAQLHKVKRRLGGSGGGGGGSSRSEGGFVGGSKGGVLLVAMAAPAHEGSSLLISFDLVLWGLSLCPISFIAKNTTTATKSSARTTIFLRSPAQSCDGGHVAISHLSIWVGHGDDVDFRGCDGGSSTAKCMVVHVGMTPKITPKLLILNMILELMIPYDKVGNGYSNGSINKLAIT
jgi:hypothetical protein